MRLILSFVLSLNMILGPFAQSVMAATASANAKIYTNEVLRYAKARKIFSAQGASAFADDYAKSFSKADRDYLVRSLAGATELPEIFVTDKGFGFTAGRVIMTFDMSLMMSERVVRDDGAVVRANFGGSLEEISAALESVLKQRHPGLGGKSSGKKVSRLWHSLESKLISPAHASGVAIGVAIAAIIGALIFKKVHAGKQSEVKKTAAAQPAYVPEPVAQAPRYTSSGVAQRSAVDYRNEADPTGASDAEAGLTRVRPSSSSTTEGRHSVEPPVVLAGGHGAPEESAEEGVEEDRPEATSEKESPDEKKSTEQGSGPQGAAQPIGRPADASTGLVATNVDERPEEFELALCNAGEDSITKIMDGLLKDYKHLLEANDMNEILAKDRALTVVTVDFYKKVINKARSLSGNEQKKEIYKSYVAFINQKFKLDPALESEKNLTQEKAEQTISELENAPRGLSVVMGSDPTINFTFNSGLGTGEITYKPGLSLTTYRSRKSGSKNEQMTLCKKEKS